MFLHRIHIVYKFPSVHVIAEIFQKSKFLACALYIIQNE